MPTSTTTRPRQPTTRSRRTSEAASCRPPSTCCATRRVPPGRTRRRCLIRPLSQWLGRINGNTRWGPLSWSLDASSNSVDYDIGRDRDDTRYQLTLSYRLTPQFQFSLIAGRETNNLVSLEDETYSDSGYGFAVDAEPADQARCAHDAAFLRQRLPDGGFSHRMPRSLFSYTASRDVSYQPAGVGNTGQGSNYDAYYAIIAASNPGLAPDAIRAQVNQVLQGRGVPADGTVVNGSLNNRPTLQKTAAALLRSSGCPEYPHFQCHRESATAAGCGQRADR
jgi:uncharacterized protein (PEP-CTERM system associated)